MGLLALRENLGVLAEQNTVTGDPFLVGDPAPSPVRDGEVLVTLGVPLWGPWAAGSKGRAKVNEANKVNDL